MRPDRAVALVLEVDGLRRGRGAVGDDLLLPGARARAEAMQRVIEGDADRFATPLTTSLATPAVANDVSMPLTSEFVGRPGLNPGTWDPIHRIRRCPWRSICPGQRRRLVHPLPPMSSRICPSGYTIGYTKSDRERRGYFLHRRRRCPIRAEGGGPVGASRRAPTTARSPPALTSL